MITLVLSGASLRAALSANTYVYESYPHNLNSNSLPVTLEAVGEAPESVAIFVQPEEPDADAPRFTPESFREALKTNRHARLFPPPRRPAVPDNPNWLPFKTNILVDLGPGNGDRKILFAYKYKAQPFDGRWSGSSVSIWRGTPTLRVVNPTNFLVSQPMIQLQGLTQPKFDRLNYERLDSQGHPVGSDDLGLGVSFPGGYDFGGSENYFTFCDVDLSPGTNTFVFHGTDEFGNTMTTNIAIVFSTAQDQTPPRITVDWPRPAAQIAGTICTINGRMDDFTARLEARVGSGNSATTHEALVERNGYFWLEDIPLVIGPNEITLTATDAAGNTTRTNFSVIACEGVVISMDPINPPELWKSFIAVTGRVSPANNDVWINGVQASVKPNGTWSAERVPVLSPSGGTAVFEMSAVPKSGATAVPAKAAAVTSAQTSLGTNEVVLNASAPACGLFRLHLSETLGKSFVLLASTNMIQWTPILTNLNSPGSFDYTVGTTGEPCRFFKIAPLP